MSTINPVIAAAPPDRWRPTSKGIVERTVAVDSVDKMRNLYKTPIAAEDVPAIVDYLANLKGGS